MIETINWNEDVQFLTTEEVYAIFDIRIGRPNANKMHNGRSSETIFRRYTQNIATAFTYRIRSYRCWFITKFMTKPEPLD